MPSPVCELCTEPGGTLLWHGKSCRVVAVDDARFPGFCRVIWNTHVAEMSDLQRDAQIHLMDVVLGVERVLREQLQPRKINLASLGNLVPHLHWHVIPRFDSDSHFPQPIWASPQRQGSPPPLPDLAQLAAVLGQVLV